MPDTTQIRFSGAIPVKTTSITVEDPEGKLKWYQILEKGFAQLLEDEQQREIYGHLEKGATLEQAWRTATMLAGVQMVCLRADDRPATPTDAISRVVLLPARELVSQLGRILESPERFAPQIFYHDGATGHSIVLFEYEPKTDTFVYLDPWPGRSLLCRENNQADVDAQPAGERRWSVTRDEVERVIIASFVFPSAWAEVMGEPYAVMYGELEAGDFWSFFHIREVGQSALDTGIRRHLKPGGDFQDHIDLFVEENERGRVVDAELRLARGFVTGPPFGISPFAADIAKSFLAAFSPPPDEEHVRPLVDALREIGNRERINAMMRDPRVGEVVGPVLMTYLGQMEESGTVLSYGQLQLANVEREGKAWLQLELRLH